MQEPVENKKSQRFSRRFSQLLKLLVILLFGICMSCNEQDLTLGLQQQQAIEIVALLHDHEIFANAQKEKGGRNLFSVSVASSDYHKAMSLLQSKSLPKVAEMSFDDLVSQRSILHNSRDIDALRLDKALALELEETLREFPNVVDAKVIVRNKFTEINTERGVSVFLSMKQGKLIDQARILPIVERAVPGVQKDHVIISLEDLVVDQDGSRKIEGPPNSDKQVVSEIELVKFLLWQVPKENFTEITLISILTLVIVLVVGIIFGYSYSGFRMGNRQHSSFEGLPEPEIMSLRLGSGKRVDSENDQEHK